MKIKNISNLLSQSRRQQRVSSPSLSNRKCSSVRRNLRETSPDMGGTGYMIGNPVMNEGNMVPWSDLPSDILSCVASRLELVDQIRFRAVCKSWRIIEEIKPNYKLPWIFMLNENGKPDYYLYDLHHQRLYGVSIQLLRTRMCLRELESRYIMCIKSGWLLLNSFFGKRFLLFNPFTQKFINLPKVPRDLLQPLSTFWYCPKSRRLVVYATSRSIISGVVIIKRWKSGNRKWESYNFAADFPSFMNKMIKIELVGEALYCVFETGVVGSFNERHKSWSVVVKYSEDDKLFSRVNNSLYHFSCTFESGGELWIMDLSRYEEFVLWRLDESKGRWVEVVQFHKRAVFCSKFKPLSVLCSEQFVPPSDPVATRVATMDYNHVHPTSDGFDPFHIMNTKFPWSHERCFPFHWIEPAFFFTNKH